MSNAGGATVNAGSSGASTVGSTDTNGGGTTSAGGATGASGSTATSDGLGGMFVSGGAGGSMVTSAGGAVTGSGGSGGTGGALAGGAGGSDGMATGGTGGAGGAGSGAPMLLSETGLYTERGADGQLVLAEGVREFEPAYWLWSDGSDKLRYVYLPPESQIDTSDPDHWVLPVGAKLWKSFVIEGQLVETRLIERTGDGPNDYQFATYYWETADATDAIKMPYEELWINAVGTQHDIPNGLMCERCHGALEDRALGFSALQLNHDLGDVNLATLTEEGWLSDPVSLDIQMPGEDQLTRDAVGYLHANCGNCHNDSPGLPVESVPEPQLLLRVSVNDLTLEDTGVFRTAINQASTASSELAVDYRIAGGNIEQSAVHFRMTKRMIEDQMPPIGTELTDPDGLELIQTWIESLPAPAE